MSKNVEEIIEFLEKANERTECCDVIIAQSKSAVRNRKKRLKHTFDRYLSNDGYDYQYRNDDTEYGEELTVMELGGAHVLVTDRGGTDQEIEVLPNPTSVIYKGELYDLTCHNDYLKLVDPDNDSIIDVDERYECLDDDEFDDDYDYYL